MMCALVLYFAIRNRSKFKTGLNSKKFAFYKKMKIEKDFSSSLSVWAKTLLGIKLG
jgi:hypothetical protein